MRTPIAMTAAVLLLGGCMVPLGRGEVVQEHGIEVVDVERAVIAEERGVAPGAEAIAAQGDLVAQLDIGDLSWELRVQGSSSSGDLCLHLGVTEPGTSSGIGHCQSDVPGPGEVSQPSITDTGNRTIVFGLVAPEIVELLVVSGGEPTGPVHTHPLEPVGIDANAYVLVLPMGAAPERLVGLDAEGSEVGTADMPPPPH